MKILMLGWEYPPHIAGGLGIACQGLTRALAHLGIDITFVIPKLYGDEYAPHMTLKDPYGALMLRKLSLTPNIKKISVPTFLNPYWSEESFKDYINSMNKKNKSPSKKQMIRDMFPHLTNEEFDTLVKKIKRSKFENEAHYGKNIFEQVANFTEQVVSIMQNEKCDLIHAHDWMTYPAGVTLSTVMKKPLISHIHSLEYDRTGVNVNPKIHSIEGLGLNSADAVISVSHYTKSIVNNQHSVPLKKIHVVHNGIDRKKTKVIQKKSKYKRQGRVVLFLGRVTYQKGPEYLLQAASKVIPYIPDALFVMAGTGDMLPRIKNLAKELGIEKNFSFPGFVRGDKLEEILSVADLYIMPSVSEPFGLSALEAIDFNTPAIISKQSGVGEVLKSSLKFDFWDVDRLADFIINGLLYKELREDLINGAKKELKKINWNISALKTLEIYKHVLSTSN